MKIYIYISPHSHISPRNPAPSLYTPRNPSPFFFLSPSQQQQEARSHCPVPNA
ncbi:hypothetical protein AHAS_Ahas15G0188200 [Arachis hypogaea]